MLTWATSHGGLCRSELLLFRAPCAACHGPLNVRWRVDGHLTFLDLNWSRPDIPPGLLCGGISAGLLAWIDNEAAAEQLHGCMPLSKGLH